MIRPGVADLLVAWAVEYPPCATNSQPCNLEDSIGITGRTIDVMVRHLDDIADTIVIHPHH